MKTLKNTEITRGGYYWYKSENMPDWNIVEINEDVVFFFGYECTNSLSSLAGDFVKIDKPISTTE